MQPNWRIFCLLVLTIPWISAGVVSSKLVTDYFLHQGVKQIAVFACWDLYGLYNIISIKTGSIHNARKNINKLMSFTFREGGIR